MSINYTRKYLIIMSLIFVVSLYACGDIKHEREDIPPSMYVKESFGMTREQFNCTWKLPNDNEVLSMADDILGGNLWVLDNLEAFPYEKVENLDWDIQYTESPNTFQLNLQSLNSVVYLTKAYEISSDISYLTYAEEIIVAWNEYKDSPKSKDNPFAWYDHGAALRSENLIYYSLVADESGNLSDTMRKLIVELIKEHEAFLSNDIYYTENHNHGIFQDRALIYSAYFLNDEESDKYLEIAKQRLKHQKEYAFNTELVHVENSPGYQIGVMNLFRVISEFLVQFEDEFGKLLYNDITHSAEFMAYIIKPNGMAAEIGDTNSYTGDTSLNVGLSVFNNDHLTYSATQGSYGAMPEKTSMFYPESGYYISHNNWDRENYPMSTWMMFKSGYQSQTHKHADDNSIMLYSKGYDIFVDPGWYNYVTGNKYRDYLVSSLAHNTVVIDGKSYSPTEENSYKTGIYEYERRAGYDYVLGYNEMYQDVKFDRHFYNLGDGIIIYDNIVSEK